MKFRILVVLLALVTFTIAACDEDTNEADVDTPIENEVEEAGQDIEQAGEDLEQDLEQVGQDLNEAASAFAQDLSFTLNNIEQQGEEIIANINFEYAGEEDINPFEEGVQDLRLVDAEGNEYEPTAFDEATGEVRFDAPDVEGPYELQYPGREPMEAEID